MGAKQTSGAFARFLTGGTMGVFSYQVPCTLKRIVQTPSPTMSALCLLHPEVARSIFKIKDPIITISKQENNYGVCTECITLEPTIFPLY